MKKIKFSLVIIWTNLISLISPIWVGLIYMDITGYGKGYGYDLGSEKSISILFGIFELILWIISLFPSMIWLCRKCFFYKKSFVLFPIFGFIILFAIGLSLLGINNFLDAFGYKYK